MGDLGKLIVAKGFKKLPKVQKIAQSGHTVPIPHISCSNPTYQLFYVEVRYGPEDQSCGFITDNTRTNLDLHQPNTAHSCLCLFWSLNHTTTVYGGFPGQIIMGGDAIPRGREFEFEYQYLFLD